VFAGDHFGEVDTRFSYIAVNALSLLGRLSDLDADKTVSYILQCHNFDGGFGNSIGAESHAAQGPCYRVEIKFWVKYFILQHLCVFLPLQSLTGFTKSTMICLVGGWLKGSFRMVV
jgi:hypothetical protein